MIIEVISKIRQNLAKRLLICRKWYLQSNPLKTLHLQIATPDKEYSIDSQTWLSLLQSKTHQEMQHITEIYYMKISNNVQTRRTPPESLLYKIKKELLNNWPSGISRVHLTTRWSDCINERWESVIFNFPFPEPYWNLNE